MSSVITKQKGLFQVQLFYALKVVMGFIFFLSLVCYHHLSCLYK